MPPSPPPIPLRDTSQVGWHVVPLFILVLYLYFRELREGRLNAVLGALAFWGMDILNEIGNGLVLHITQRAPVWGLAHSSSLLIFVGLNLEISLGFAILGLAATQLLPADPRRAWLGIGNRLWFACAHSVLCVAVEMVLHRWGMLTWAWPWWNARAPWGIFLIGYLPFFLVCYAVHDMTSRRRQIATVAGILGLGAVLALAFIQMGWI